MSYHNFTAEQIEKILLLKDKNGLQRYSSFGRQEIPPLSLFGTYIFWKNRFSHPVWATFREISETSVE